MMLLFQEDLSGVDAAETKRLFWQSHPGDPDTRDFAEYLFDCAIQKKQTVDELITQHASNWRLERIAAVDRNVLRMAITEFLFTDTPRAVVIDEAIEIARKFGGEKSAEFVNGVLDAVMERVERSSV